MFKKKNKKNVTPEMIEKVILKTAGEIEDKTVDYFIERVKTFEDAVENTDMFKDSKEVANQMIPYLAAMITAECVCIETMRTVLTELLCDEKPE